MKAVRIHAFGGPEVVTYEDIPQPVPKAHEDLLMGFSLPATFPHSDNQAAMAESLDLLTANKVRLIVDQVLPLSEAAEAHARLANRGAMGKIILVP